MTRVLTDRICGHTFTVDRTPSGLVHCVDGQCTTAASFNTIMQDAHDAAYGNVPGARQELAWLAADNAATDSIDITE